MYLQSESETETLLSSHDLKGVAEFIKSGKCEKVAILAGAGISVSAGIPDFRSKTGFYKNYSTDDFPMLTKQQVVQLKNDPEHIFTIGLFRENPSVYLHARKSFMLAKDEYSPTTTHWFFKLLETKNLLKRFYSTNIDSLDVATDISPDILVHVHGTCGAAICYQCGEEYDMGKLRKLLKEKVHEKQFIRCDKCNTDRNWIKPNTVLFGEGLPPRYFELVSGERDLDDVDLLIVAGTSLSVSPSNMIPSYVKKERCVRLLLNREKCGWDFDFNTTASNDVFYKGDCDEGIIELAKLCGWDKQLMEMKECYDNKLNAMKNNDDSKVEQKEDDESKDEI